MAMTDETSEAERQIEDANLREKRLSESQPFELEMAFKQVLKDPQAKPEEPLAEGAEQTKAEVKSSAEYTRSANLFADIFYGVLVAPRQTMQILSDGKKYPATFHHLTQSIFFMTLVLSLVGWLRFKLDRVADTAVSSLVFTLSGIELWFVLAVILYYLGSFARVKVRFGNALVSIAWAFLPVLFFTPIMCFKKLLGLGIMLPGMVVAMWFLYLLFAAFQSALKTSALKMSLIVIVVPPLFAFVYLFWMGLAVFSLGMQLLPRLVN